MSCQAGNVWNRPIFSRIGLPKINSVTAPYLSLNEGMTSWTQNGKPNDQWQDKEHFVNSEPETEPESSNESEHRSIDGNFREPFFTHNLKTLRLPGFHPALSNIGVRAAGSFKDSAGKASQHTTSANDIQRLCRRQFAIAQNFG